MQKSSEKVQKTPFLPFLHDAVGKDAEKPYMVNTVPYRQGDRPITRLHTHEQLEFGICLEGSGIFMIGSNVFPFQSGDCTFIPAWVPHLAQSTSGTESRWHWLYPDCARLLLWAPELADFNCSRESVPYLLPPDRNHVIREMFEAVRGEPDAYTVRELAALIALFSIGLHREGGAGMVNRSGALERVRPALDLIAHSCTREIPAARLAAACNLSANQFRRVFRQATGKRPVEYLHECRIAMAMSLLRTGTLTQEEVADRCGYRTVSSFYRQFVKYAGCSPGRYR